MNEHPGHGASGERDLEEVVGRALRELPPRRAPFTLESRVLAALERHAAHSGRRRGFGRWPWGMRMAFGSTCAALAVLTIPSSSRVLAELGAFHALMLPWLDDALAVADTLRAVTGSFTRSVPADWLYVGLGASAALYAALFGLAIAAYRLLYVHSEPSRSGPNRPAKVSS
jgi:hypothetical protein